MTLSNTLVHPMSGMRLGSCVAMYVLVVGWSAAALAAQKAPSRAESTDDDVSSGITTQVQQETEHGPPSEEEQRHISVLGAQVLRQISRARDAIDADDRAAAEEAVGKAQQALKIVRQMLPKSLLTTTVMNPQGDALYEDTEEVQADYVTVFRSFTAFDIVRPLIASKKNSAQVGGDEFEGGGLVEADVVVDLGFVERRLGAAKRALSKDIRAADDSLVAAQNRGTTLTLVTIESPLAEAREAMQFAHKAATREEYQAAEANLRIARGYLSLYREAAPDASKEEVDALNKEIDLTAQQIATTTPENHQAATGSVKRILDKVSSWWHNSNQNKSATDSSSSKTSPRSTGKQ
jgi:hypothetical protein